VPKLDRAERDALIVASQPLVTTIAGDFRRLTRVRRIEWDDVIAEGLLGLVEAAERFDSSRLSPSRFGSFVRVRIWARIYEFVHGRPPHVTGLDLDRLPAKRRLPTLVPLFGCISFTPANRCGHRAPIPKRSDFCCMVCHQSGWDHLDALQIDPADMPRPERRKAPALPLATTGPETRRQRRARLYGAARLEPQIRLDS
jgi:hypothetical protein